MESRYKEGLQVSDRQPDWGRAGGQWGLCYWTASWEGVVGPEGTEVGWAQKTVWTLSSRSDHFLAKRLLFMPYLQQVSQRHFRAATGCGTGSCSATETHGRDSPRAKHPRRLLSPAHTLGCPLGWTILPPWRCMAAC